MKAHYSPLTSWKPGVSGNTLGAGVSKLKLAVEIRQISQNGREMIDFLFSVMRGLPLPMPVKKGPNRRGHGKPPRPSPELQVRAAEILLDRAFGKAKEILELGGEGSEDEQRRRSRAMIAQLSVAERAQLRTLLETARERAERAFGLPTTDVRFQEAAAAGPQLQINLDRMAKILSAAGYGEIRTGVFTPRGDHPAATCRMASHPRTGWTIHI
jgi:hypothetical protein